jgi:hypothetical protein
MGQFDSWQELFESRIRAAKFILAACGIGLSVGSLIIVGGHILRLNKPGCAVVEVVGNEVDDDCDGTEICYIDLDDDWFRSGLGLQIGSADADCTDPFEAKASDPATDCDDLKALINPAATDTCGDGVDEDCDGADAVCPHFFGQYTWYRDGDSDRYGDSTNSKTTETDEAPRGFVSASGDCNDARSDVYPGAPDLTANGYDNDCDGVDGSH